MRITASVYKYKYVQNWSAFISNNNKIIYSIYLKDFFFLTQKKSKQKKKMSTF